MASDSSSFDLETPAEPIWIVPERVADSGPAASGASSAGAGVARSPWMRFLDTFLQEQNIQWILGVGMLILVGSSLMLVTSHWDTYTPVWKHLILLGYTAGLHLAGQLAWRSLGLRKTGTALMALTVLLIPLTFLAMRWIHPAEALSPGSLVHHAGLLGLLAANTVFAVLAARRVFNHFLRRPQPTFIASYVILSLAGALIPTLTAAAIPWATGFLWLVFAAGSIKVNRHVFWLTEERRLPRIFGFFPIFLLGGQFLMLLAAGLAPHVPLEWIGFGCVLTAIPVLLTADALAAVHQQRHGAVARPLPWGIVLPIFAGVVLTLAGVCLAGLRYPQAPVLVPTAAAGAIVMAIVAYRTSKRAFAWAMVIGLTIAYQCSPVFYRELARHVVQQGALAVHEQRLPIAFYGLTYLPLLLTATVVSARRRARGDELFAPVLKQFAIGLPIFLSLAALTHSKALFPVNLALTGLFAIQAWLFRDRRILPLAATTWLLAALGFPLFATQVLSVGGSLELSLLPWTIASTLLLCPGALIERTTHRWLPAEQRGGASPIFETASLLASLLVAAAWLLPAVVHHAAAPVAGAAIAALLLVHAYRVVRSALGEVALSFAVAVPALLLWAGSTSISPMVTLIVSILSAAWVALPLLQKRPTSRLTRAFAQPAERVIVTGMLCVLALFLAPRWVAAILPLQPFTEWAVTIVVTLWALAEARRLESPVLCVIGWVALLATLGTAALALGGPGLQAWLPALWAGVAAVVAPWIGRRDADAVITVDPDRIAADTRIPVRTALRFSVLATLEVIAVLTLFVFTTPMRAAGAVSLVGLFVLASVCRDTTLRAFALMLANGQVLCAVIQWFAPGVHDLSRLTLAVFSPAALPVAFAAVVQALAWQRSLSIRSAEHHMAMLQSMTLQGIGIFCLATRVVEPFRELLPFEFVLVCGAFACLIADRIATALRVSAEAASQPASDGVPANAASAGIEMRPGEGHVWAAEVLVLAAIGYLTLFRVIEFGHGLCMFAVLGAGAAAWAVSRWAETSSRTAVLVQPLWTTAFLLPAVAVILGIGRHVYVANPAWLGMNSLALLLAAGFYFWQGLETRSKELLVGSAAILNVALALLWRELDLTDPQFFMIPLGISILGLIELLHDEIPEEAINPLRYLGALTILVSPTFHIVGGSWLHLFSLMVASVAITLTAMGLRIRALMYTGTAFLLADIVAMVVRGSIDQPSILWIAGIALGTLIITLAAYCERNREKMLQRLRMIAAELESWR